MIKLFVFDLGGVILPFDHKDIAYRLHEVSEIREDLTPEQIFDFLFDHDHGFVNPYEEGRISSFHFFEHIKEKFHLKIDFEAFKGIWNPIFREDEGVKNIISSLKSKGYPLFLLSNTNELHFCYIKDNYPVVYLMDKWILSYKVGAKKPKSEIYEAVLRETNFAPKEILYIDDIPHYVEAAFRLGIKGVVFKDAGSLRKFMREIGAEI
jgi:putative hydrolase of the HAD superfamily